MLSVREEMQGAADREILDRAEREGRVLLTCDRDFGELAIRSGMPATCGVVLLRLSGPSPGVDNARALLALESRSDWAGHLSVVTDDRIRMRPLRSPMSRD